MVKILSEGLCHDGSPDRLSAQALRDRVQPGQAYPQRSSFKKNKGERTTKSNFGGIIRINLTKVNFDYSLMQNIKTTWKLSNIDFKYIINLPEIQEFNNIYYMNIL